MIEAQKYTNTFFSEMEEASYKAATIILPIVADLIKPKTVVDIGCGTGMWLKVWDNIIGVKDYLGVEGPYLEKEKIQVDGGKIILKDLKGNLDIDRKFDLAMSLEVAEHLPETTAHQFIKTLTQLSDVVFFSAAIPGQIGTYHINEQYPEYWVAIFKELGYTPIDCIRDLIWNNAEIEFWYQQNILLFVKSDKVQNYPALSAYLHTASNQNFTRIHPVIYNLKLKQVKNTETVFGFINWKWYMFKRKYLYKNAQ